MNVRALAAAVLEEVLENGGKSHLLLQKTMAEQTLSARDRHLLTRLVHGTVEQLLLLDARLAEISSVPPGRMKKTVRTVLRMSLYQLFFMDNIPASAVCNEAVELIKAGKYKGLAGFVNGILRTAARREHWAELPENIRLGMPEELFGIFCERFGREEAVKACESFQEPAVLSVRVNLSKTGRDRVRTMFAEEGMEAEPSSLAESMLLLKNAGGDALPLEAQRPLREGLVQVQDISSVLAVTAAAPRAGENVLDICAAPGGKTLHAADLMAAEAAARGKMPGSITACDLSEQKCRLIRENVRRNGFDFIRTFAADAAVFDPAKEEAYDLVIADLPCSGLGVIGRKPEIRFRVGRKEIAELAQLQRQILSSALRYVKKGGRLLFSTCTVTKEENTDNAAWLAAQPGWEPADFSAEMPECFRERAARGQLQIRPGEAGLDGFFISLFQKQA